MGQLRVEKVQELMKQEISQIILRELKDPRIGFVNRNFRGMYGRFAGGQGLCEPDGK